MIANAEPAIDVEVEPATKGSEIALRPENANGIAVREAEPVTINRPSRDLTIEVTRYDLIEKQARMLAHSSFVPAHLVDKDDPLRTQANCFRVAFQADKWNRSVFDVADRTYVTAGKLGYEGKLAASVINTLAGIKGRLDYEYSGSGEDRTVVVSATFRNETKPRTISLSVKQARTKNEMWSKDPDQKLAYCGALRWARRHCPEVLDGVFTDDDLEVIAEQEAPPPDTRTPEEIAAEAEAKRVEAERVKAEAVAKQRAALTGGLAGSGSAVQPTTTTAPPVQQPTTHSQAKPEITTPFDAPLLVNAATKARIIAAFKPSGLTQAQFGELLVKHGGPGTDALGKLTQPQALQLEGELLQAASQAGNARQEVAAVEKPVAALIEDDKTTAVSLCSECGAMQFETPSGITCANGHGGAAAAEPPVVQQPPAAPQSGPVCDPINLARLNKLVKETQPLGVWPMHEIKSYLAARKVQRFNDISNQDAVKLIGEIEGRLAKAKAGAA